MKLSISVKSVFAKILGSCGIPEAAIRNRSGKRYLILMYHRIVPSDQASSTTQAGMYVDPKTFEEHIRYLLRLFHVIPFSDRFSSSDSRDKSESSRPFCILTFDDGWRDFYEYAYPVLLRNQVPATVFVPTGFVGTGKWFWSDRVAWHLKQSDSFAVMRRHAVHAGEPLLDKIMGLTGPFEKRLEAAIGFLKNRSRGEIEQVIEAMSRQRGAHPVPDRRVFLHWDEIREMRGSGLISFGSHTHNHRILVHLEEQEIREELSVSRENLLREAAADPSFIPFCYPNGNWNERIAGMVREAGYHATVSTGNGWNDEGSSAFGLKRVAIHQDMTATREMFGCRLAEIL